MYLVIHSIRMLNCMLAKGSDCVCQVQHQFTTGLPGASTVLTHVKRDGEEGREVEGGGRKERT